MVTTNNICSTSESKNNVQISWHRTNSNNIERKSLSVGNIVQQSFLEKVEIIKSVKNTLEIIDFTQEEIKFIEDENDIEDSEDISPKLIPFVQKRFTEKAFAFLDKKQTQALNTEEIDGERFWHKDLKVKYLLPKQIPGLQRFFYTDDLQTLSKPQFQALDMQQLLEKDPQSAELSKWSLTDQICKSIELLNYLTPEQFKIIQHKVQPELWPDLDSSLDFF